MDRIDRRGFLGGRLVVRIGRVRANGDDRTVIGLQATSREFLFDPPLKPVLRQRSEASRARA